MPTNFFVPVAAAAGSNVTTDAAWDGSSFQVSGVTKGIVPSAGMNKAWRQGTMGTSALGQIIVDHLLVDAVDDGSVPGLKANLRAGIAAMLSGTAFAADQSSTANLLVAILDPAPPTLSTYRSIFVRVANTNTGAVSLALNNLGTKPVVRKNGLPFVAGDLLQGQFVHLAYDLVLGQWTALGSVASDTSAAIKNYIINQPPVQSLFVDPANGNDLNDGSAPGKAKKSFENLLDAMGTTATAFFLMSDITLTRRHNIYAPLTLYGVQAAQNTAGYIFTQRFIGFLGTATNSPDNLGNTYPSGLSMAGPSVVTSFISFVLPAQVANQTYPAHLYSDSGANFTLLSGALSVSSASAAALVGTHSLSLNVYSNLSLASGAAGHLFEGIPAGTNPNNFYNYRSNVTSG